jgi:2-oxo-4-hydroxy-4-carboxy--5-ureidoimidazoline (OHCU) decarboxylase
VAGRADLAVIFERSPVLLERLTPLVMPTDSPERIVEMAHAIIDALDEGDRIAALNAHPRLGAPAASLSALSAAEQGDDAGVETLRVLADLNGTYERRFGFRFVVFVNGRRKRDILPVLRARLARTREQELATGIDEFLAISLDRLRRAADQDQIRRAMDVDS